MGLENILRQDDIIMGLENMLRQGDIIMVKGESPISWLVKTFTNSPYSHCAMYIGDYDGEVQLIESKYGGVKLVGLSKYDNVKYDIYRHKTATLDQLDTTCLWLGSQLGSGYDYMGVIGIGLKLLGLTKHNELDEKDRYWCSELLADGMLFSEIKLDIKKDTHLVSPGDLANNNNLVMVYNRK